MREKWTLPKNLFLPHVRHRSKRQREVQAQFYNYRIWIASSTQLRVQTEALQQYLLSVINPDLDQIKPSWFKSLIQPVEVVIIHRRQVLMTFSSKLKANITRYNTLNTRTKCPPRWQTLWQRFRTTLLFPAPQERNYRTSLKKDEDVGCRRLWGLPTNRGRQSKRTKVLAVKSLKWVVEARVLVLNDREGSEREANLWLTQKGWESTR